MKNIDITNVLISYFISWKNNNDKNVNFKEHRLNKCPSFLQQNDVMMSRE